MRSNGVPTRDRIEAVVLASVGLFAAAVMLVSLFLGSAGAAQFSTYPSPTAKLNRSETAQVAAGGFTAFNIGRQILPGQWKAAAVGFAGMALYAKGIHAAGRCLSVRVILISPWVYPAWYTGGHCKYPDTPGMVRGSMWYLRNSPSGGSANAAFNYGRAGDIAVTGDWNGDGIDTVAMVRGSMWFIRNSNSPGSGEISFNYGRPGDIPVSGDWNGDGIDTPGMIRGSMWYLRNSSSGGSADISFNYGRVGDRPVAGAWVR